MYYKQYRFQKKIWYPQIITFHLMSPVKTHRIWDTPIYGNPYAIPRSTQRTKKVPHYGKSAVAAQKCENENQGC